MNDLVLSVKLTGDAGDLNGEVSLSTKEFEKLAKSTEKTGKAADRSGRKMDRYGKETREASREAAKLNKANKSLASSMAGVFAGLSFTLAAREIQSVVSAGQDLETRIQGLVGGTAALADEQSYLYQTSKDLHQDIDVLTDSYARMLSLQKSGITTQKESRIILEGLADASIELAASNAQVQQVMYGLSQALSSPKVRAEELNQVVEPLPGLLAEMDKAAQLPAGGFRQMVIDGKVTSKLFKTTLIEALKSYEGAAERAGNNLSRIYADIGTEYKTLVRELAEPFEGDVVDGLKGIEGALISARENIDQISTVAEVGSTALMGLIAAKTASALASSQFVTALRTEYAAQVQAMTANRAAAAFLGVQYVTAQTRATSADRARAVSLTAMTGAANLAKGSLAFLGGPAGLIALGATAMVMWATSADEAAASTEDYSLKLAQLEGNLKKVEQAELEGEIRRYETIKKRLANDLGDISFWDVLSGDTGERTKIRLELNQVNAILLTAKRRLQELGVEAGKAGQKTGEQADETGKAADKLKEFINALREEQETLGMSAAALARYKAAKLGGSAADQALAASLAAEIEALHEMDRLLDSYIADEEAITAARKERTEANQALITTLQQEYELSQMGDRERAVEIQLRKLSADATDEQKQSVIEWTETIYDAAKASEVLQKQQEKLAEENRKAMEKIENATSRSLQTAEDAFIDFVHTGKLSFADLITSIMDEMLRLQFQETVSPWLGDIFGSIFSTSSVSSAWDSMPMDFSVFSGDGNVVTPYGPVALQKFGDGGITQGVVNRPTVLNMAGERYKSEAVVPLPDGRAIPVDMQGGGQSIVFSPTTHIDARGADAGMLPKLRQIAREESERSLSQFKREINRGGSAARLVGRRG
ncbi:MAG: tape measure protein [Candidatus Sedimenticola sp. (ex Thyasira tokunagai)]